MRQPAPVPRPAPVCVTTPAGEWHGLAARMVAEGLRARGWDALYLGCDLPADHLGRFLDRVQPAVLLLSCTTAAVLPQLAGSLDVAMDVATDVRRWIRLRHGRAPRSGCGRECVGEGRGVRACAAQPMGGRRRHSAARPAGRYPGRLPGTDQSAQHARGPDRGSISGDVGSPPRCWPPSVHDAAARRRAAGRSRSKPVGGRPNPVGRARQLASRHVGRTGDTARHDIVPARGP